MGAETPTADLILSIEDALVLLGGRPFFEDLSFHIHRGRKIALVGRNGAGKTTLMNMITGDRPLDDGTRWVLKGVSAGHMRQHVDPVPGQTVQDFVFAEMSEALEDWDRTYRMEMAVEPLGLKGGDRMDSLSGGMLRRAALARALVEQPDILLLDEPTNHMDLDLIQWLESYLRAYKGAVLCVSHDRAFLSAVTDRVFWLDRGALKVCPYGFARFGEWAQEQIEQESRALRNREKRVEQELEWANRGVKARVKRNVRRVAQAKEEATALEADKAAFRRATRKIELAAPESEESSLRVAEFISVGKSFADPESGTEKLILKKFNLRVRRRDRVGLVGRNGTGKTTFLRLLTGEIAPDTGKVKRASDLTFGYFDQKRAALDPEKTLQENLCPPGSDHLDVRGTSRHVCGYLKDFLFDPEDAWRQAKTLSGGQMNRLMLARVLAAPGSFLILDEPTNDLDMDTLDMLEAILAAYDGTLFVVSHDRDFMDKVVNTLLVFEGNGRVDVIAGGYSDYLATRKADPAPVQDGPARRKAPAAAPGEKAPVKMTFKLKHELERLPQTIAALERDRNALEDALAQPDFYGRDPKAYLESARRLEELRTALDAAETRWLELEEMREG